MMSRRDGSSTTINVIATGKAKPVTASNSIINITEKVHTFPVQEEANEEKKPDVPSEHGKAQVADELQFLHVMKNAYVFIVHNKVFSKREEAVRYGSDKDLRSLTDLFGQELGFKVKVVENRTASEILGETGEISERDFSKYDALFFIILSHGNQTGILGVDEEPASLAALTDCFTADKCPSLIGKPKVFLVQACRGEKDDLGAVVSDATPGPAVNAALQAVPVESDFLVCYASPIGYSSYRDTEDGSWYIQELVKIFKKYYTREHLMDLMLRVNFAVSRKSCADRLKQIPSEECRLTKKCYFLSLPQSND